MAKVHIGTMGWSYNFWVGNFYPAGATSEEFLTEYSRHFNTVEVDNTFYGIPYETTVTKWKNQTLADFLFSSKFPRVITHEKMLTNCQDDVERFIKRISLLQIKLGPLLLQFPYGFKPEHLHLLRDFLPTLPKGYRFVVEVRNKKLLSDDLYSLLTENGVALAFTDYAFMPKVEKLTADFAYFRWEGDRRKVKGIIGKVEVDKTNDIESWAEKIKMLQSNSIEVFGYFSKYYSGHPPSDAKQLLNFLQN